MGELSQDSSLRAMQMENEEMMATLGERDKIALEVFERRRIIAQF